MTAPGKEEEGGCPKKQIFETFHNDCTSSGAVDRAQPKASLIPPQHNYCLLLLGSAEIWRRKQVVWTKRREESQ